MGKRDKKRGNIKGVVRVRGDYFKDEPLRTEKTDRNAPCPCGSDQKYKKCCGSAVSKGVIGWLKSLFGA